MSVTIDLMTGMPVMTPRPKVIVTGGSGNIPRPTGGGGSGESFMNDIPPQVADGVRTSFNTNVPYISGNLIVFLNGLRESHFSEVNSTTFQFSSAPLTGDEIALFYQTS